MAVLTFLFWAEIKRLISVLYVSCADNHSGTLFPVVLTAISHSYGNCQNSTPHKIQTP